MILRYLRYMKNYVMTQNKKNVITVVGTTGVGKSQFSIDLANRINGEIINADSMQVYERAPIITNKHPMEERDGVPHHVMDHVPWNQDYFIHRYSQEANQAIADIHARGKIPIIIGGTHYYLQNLLFKNKTVGEKEDPAKLRELSRDEAELLENGPTEQILEQLRQVDPVISEKFHPQDRRKLVRALEIYLKTGQRASELYQEQKLDELEDSCLRFNTLIFWLYCDREILKDRLDTRVDKMMDGGAQDEINELYDFYKQFDPAPDCTKGILQVIGFKEFLPWLQSNKQDKKLFDEGVERMKIRTRQYARYQTKWITKMLGVELNKEAAFNYKYGGKMYLLDATELTQWSDKVKSRGVGIAEQFLNNGPLGVSEPQAPAGLESILPTSEFYESFNSNKTLKSVNNWKHFECPVCKDSEGKPLVAVGEDNWNVHVKSRRHKKQVGYNQRKREHDEIVAKYKKQKEA